MLDMRPLTDSPPEVVQGQRGTLVHILRLRALYVVFNVEEMLQLYRHERERGGNMFKAASRKKPNKLC